MTMTSNQSVIQGAASLTVIIGCGGCDAPASHHRSQWRDPYYLVGGDNEVLMDGADSEPGTLADVLVHRPLPSAVMYADIEHMHTALVLAVVAPHVCQRTIRLDHNSN